MTNFTETAYNATDATKAEVKAIGALLLDPERIVKQAGEVGIKSKHFGSPIHAKAWGFLFGRASKGETISLAELPALCPKELKELDGTISGLALLQGWQMDTPTAHHFPEHAGLVIEAANRRRIHEDLARAMETNVSGDSLGEVAEILTNAATVASSTGLEEGGRAPLVSFHVDHSSTIGMTWEQIEALRPPIVIDGFVRQGEVLLLGAESKSRKSWLAQDAGIAVATGTPWLQTDDDEKQSGFKTEVANVHVFDLELSLSEVKYRFAKARGNAFPGDLESQKRVSERFNSYALEGESAVEILAYLDEVGSKVEAGDLVVIDCLYRLQADGNETEAVSEILEAVKRFAKKTKAGVIVVDHFRKAGADKARDRFAGTFVKQASAAMLVAIEVKAEDTLVLNLDGRTFHGVKEVHARFDPESYRFHQISEEDVKAAREAKVKSEQEARLVQIWGNKSLDAVVTNADARDKWNLSRQATDTRFGSLEKVQMVEIAKNEKGKAKTWGLTTEGRAIVARNLNLHPDLHPQL